MKETLITYGVTNETINTYNDITYLLNKYADKFDFNNSIFVTLLTTLTGPRKFLRRNI